MELTALPFESNCLAEVETKQEVARDEGVCTPDPCCCELKMKHGSYKIQQAAFPPFLQNELILLDLCS